LVPLAEATGCRPMTEALQVDGDKLYAKIAWRIIPFMFVLYIAAFLDRVNVGHAKLMFQADLGLSDAAFGLGAGLFFVGYFLFEVPSNLILEKVGARVWIARIMLSWGVVSCSFMFMQGEWSFYFLRFLLGVTEAGFFPGMILYLTYWFPVRLRARMVARFMAAIPVSWIIGSPLSGWIMHGMHDVGGMAGWQWMFLLEGLPTLVLGVLVLFWLTDGPTKATWLTEAEKQWLHADLEMDRARIADGGRKDVAGAFTDWRVWYLVGLYLTNVIANYGLSLWMPQVISDSLPKDAKPGTSSTFLAASLTAIPWIVTFFVMITNGWHSDKTNERKWHIAIPHVIAASGMLGCLMFLDNTVMLIACLCVAAAGINSVLGVFWALPASFLTGAAAAGGIAVINSIGNLGGFLGPYTMGALKSGFGKTEESWLLRFLHWSGLDGVLGADLVHKLSVGFGYHGGFIAIACSLVVGAVLVVMFKPKKNA
jgi:MFS transporter, ACS family, tartrate transporter